MSFKLLEKQTRHHEVVQNETIVEKSNVEKVVKIEEIVFNAPEVSLVSNITNATVRVHHRNHGKKSRGHYQQGAYKLCWSLGNETFHFVLKANITELELTSDRVWASLAFSNEKVLVTKKYINFVEMPLKCLEYSWYATFT